MAHSAAIVWREKTAAGSSSVPWYIWACVAAVTSASFGGVWDISWHESIGRDTFWTAPHLFIHFGGILAGAASAWLIFHTTFAGTPSERAARGPYLGILRSAGRLPLLLGWRGYGHLGAFR